jgi:cytochrome P450
MSDQARTEPIGRSEADQARNRMMGIGVVDDPYPTYAQLLAECPAHRGSITARFGIEGPLAATGAAGGAPEPVSVHSYELCAEVLRRAGTYSSSWYDVSLRPVIGHTLIGMDEPEHRRMRLLLQSAFSRAAMDRWETEIVQPIVDEHIDAFAARGHADLDRELASIVPMQSISAGLGLPMADREQFFEWAVRMASTLEPPEQRLAIADAVADYIAPIVDERREHPRDDLISVLVHARLSAEDVAAGVDSRPLSSDEIAAFVRLLIIAGASTTYRAFSTLVYLLLTNPAEYRAVRDDRSLVANAIEESLRIEQPLAHVGRIAAADAELGGVTVEQGATVNINLAAANHDPREWHEPERFDVRRARADRHLSFGFGIHRCLGIHLARAELRVLLNRTLDRLPNLRLAPGAAPGTAPHMTGLVFRMPTSLPVVFDPAPSAR